VVATQQDNGGSIESKSYEDMVLGLLNALTVVVDPRRKRGKRYLLLDVLAIAVLGCLCGCNNAEALEDWAKKEEQWLTRFLALPRGTPGQDVFLRVLAAIDPAQFQKAFLCWVREVFHHLGVNDQIAIDGQTNRGSGDRNAKRSPIHMVHALACGKSLIVGQAKTEAKSNEITAIPVLLELLDLRGSLVSIDAMGCQVTIAKLIKDKGGDYLLGLKGNQSALRDETEALFKKAQDPPSSNLDAAQPPAIQQVTDVDKGHGRIETRTAKVITKFKDWVPSAVRWPNMETLIAVDAIREEVISGKISQETRFYISSRALTAEEAMTSVRKHWLVENTLHWCLDVTFDQDANQTRTNNAAENLAVVRHFALNLIRKYDGDSHSMPRRRRLCDYRIEYREKILGIQPV
jgi:predicted transposase YbfD/YdcC